MILSRKRFDLLFSIGLALAGITAMWLGARSVVSATDSPLAVPDARLDAAAPAEARLHNPNFDNHIWYEFSERHDPSYPKGVWLPAGDTYDDTQDWRLWFLNGTDLVDVDPTKSVVNTPPECVQFRNFTAPNAQSQVAGLYQAVPGATPCLLYQFQMYGLSRQKDAGDSLRDLKVGIEPTGWALDSKYAPAVHSWPTMMVWGPSHLYTSAFGPLTVTAEALSTQITVFSYADAYGGNSHKIHWDTASLLDVTPERIQDPANLPAPAIFDASATVGTTSATISWTTGNAALGQVYYRPVPSGGTAQPLTYTVFLPVLFGAAPRDWLATPLDKTPRTVHSVVLNDLSPGQSYEYIAVSRGLSGMQCVTWVSEKLGFTTNE